MSVPGDQTTQTRHLDPPDGSTSRARCDRPRTAPPDRVGPDGARAVRPDHALSEQTPLWESLSDVELLRAHLDRDPQSFNELVRRHRTLLRVVALRVLENHHDADDAVQDGLIKAFRSAHTYLGRGSVGAWLRTIIENTARTAARNRARDHQRSTMIPERRDLVDPSPDGADPARVVAARAAVAEALAQIPQQWRHTFELVKVSGLSYAEAAEVLDVPIGTVRSRINRANAARAHHRVTCRDGGNHPGPAASLLCA